MALCEKMSTFVVSAESESPNHESPNTGLSQHSIKPAAEPSIDAPESQILQASQNGKRIGEIASPESSIRSVPPPKEKRDGEVNSPQSSISSVTTQKDYGGVSSPESSIQPQVVQKHEQNVKATLPSQLLAAHFSQKERNKYSVAELLFKGSTETSLDAKFGQNFHEPLLKGGTETFLDAYIRQNVLKFVLKESTETYLHLLELLLEGSTETSLDAKTDQKSLEQLSKESTETSFDAKIDKNYMLELLSRGSTETDRHVLVELLSIGSTESDRHFLELLLEGSTETSLDAKTDQKSLEQLLKFMHSFDAKKIMSEIFSKGLTETDRHFLELLSKGLTRAFFDTMIDQRLLLSKGLTRAFIDTMIDRRLLKLLSKGLIDAKIDEKMLELFSRGSTESDRQLLELLSKGLTETPDAKIEKMLEFFSKRSTETDRHVLVELFSRGSTESDRHLLELLSKELTRAFFDAMIDRRLLKLLLKGSTETFFDAKIDRRSIELPSLKGLADTVLTANVKEKKRQRKYDFLTEDLLHHRKTKVDMLHDRKTKVEKISSKAFDQQDGYHKKGRLGGYPSYGIAADPKVLHMAVDDLAAHINKEIKKASVGCSKVNPQHVVQDSLGRVLLGAVGYCDEDKREDEDKVHVLQVDDGEQSTVISCDGEEFCYIPNPATMKLCGQVTGVGDAEQFMEFLTHKMNELHNYHSEANTSLEKQSTSESEDSFNKFNNRRKCPSFRIRYKGKLWYNESCQERTDSDHDSSKQPKKRKKLKKMKKLHVITRQRSESSNSDDASDVLSLTDMCSICSSDRL